MKKTLSALVALTIAVTSLWLATDKRVRAGIVCTLPVTLQNGTTADASQVMADFNAIVACFQNNIAASGANNDITGLFALTTPIAPINGGTPTYIGSNSAGTANAQTIASTVPFNFTLSAGRSVRFVAGLGNTGPMTLNVVGSGNVNVYKAISTGIGPLVGGEIAPNQVVVVTYDGTQWVINGAQYNFLDNYIGGLRLANNSVAPTSSIDIAVGTAADDGNQTMMRLLSAMTKSVTSGWVVGSNQGCLDTGVVANTTYHFWLIQRSDTGVVDVLCSTSATAPSMPSNYDRKRRIGAILRETGANVAFTQTGNGTERYMRRATPVQDINTTTLSTTGATFALSVPAGISVRVTMLLSFFDDVASAALYIRNPSDADVSPAPAGFLRVPANNEQLSGYGEVFTDTSRQVFARSSLATSTLVESTVGWTESLGP